MQPNSSLWWCDVATSRLWRYENRKMVLTYTNAYQGVRPCDWEYKKGTVKRTLILVEGI